MVSRENLFFVKEDDRNVYTVLSSSNLGERMKGDKNERKVF